MKRLVLCGLVALCTLRLCAITQEEATQNLRDAILSSGDLVAAQKAIDDGADVNTMKDDHTLFFDAVCMNDTDFVKLFFQSPWLTAETVNKIFVDSDEYPFDVALREENIEVIKLFLKSKKLMPESVNRINAEGKTVLYWAIDNPEILELLLNAPVLDKKLVNKKYKTSFGNSSLLFIVASRKKQKALELLLGVPELTAETVNEVVDRWSILDIAISRGDADLVKVLVASPLLSQETINRKIKTFGTPLYYAFSYHLAVFEELLNSPHLLPTTVTEVLVKAAIDGRKEVVEMLIALNKIDEKLLLNKMAFACKTGLDKGLIDLLAYPEVKLFINKPIDEPGIYMGQTLLHRAAFGGQADIAKLLIKAGANPQLKDKQGKLPADLVPEKDAALKELLQVKPTGDLTKELEQLTCALKALL